MAKKKGASTIADTLTGPSQPRGWKNQFGEPDVQIADKAIEQDPKQGNGYKRKTYLMTDDLITRIEAQANTYDVGINEMARYCFDLALSLMEAGEHKPPVKEIVTHKRTLDV